MTPTQELRLLILAAQRTGERMMGGVMRPLGLTSSQSEVLSVLHEAGPMSLAELGARLVCEAGSPSRLVSGLVERGLVRREVSKSDARIAELSLSPEGAALLGQLKALDDDISAKVAASLTAKQVETMVAGLRKLLAHTPAGQAVARRRG